MWSKSGSFVGAAERMEMSAAMASKHVMHLEQQLGARLLNRTTRRVAPTEAGREYYERLSQVLTELEEAEQVVGAASVVPQGRLRVSSLSAFGLSHVMSAVADYAAQYPQVTVDMTLSDRVVELIDEGFDVAIRASPCGPEVVLADCAADRDRASGVVRVARVSAPARHAEKHRRSVAPQLSAVRGRRRARTRPCERRWRRRVCGCPAI